MRGASQGGGLLAEPAQLVEIAAEERSFVPAPGLDVEDGADVICHVGGPMADVCQLPVHRPGRPSLSR